jgi:hypothetical protein
MENEMADSSPSPRNRLPLPGWALAFLAVLLIGAPLGVNAALQLSPGADSPATGHAQVVTQGIVRVRADQVVWRLVERTARPRWEAIPARKANGFILASEEPVLLSNFDDRGLTDIARLAPGEAMIVTDVNRTVRASFTDQSTKYFALELVPAAEADDIGSGDLLFKSAAFTAPSGKRDVDLVRDVLAAGESATIPDSGQENVVLATEGAIDVIPGDGRTTRLEAGESATFIGEFKVQAAQAGGSGVLPVAAMTAYLAQDQPSRSSFVIAVIGEEIPPPATPTPTNTPTATATLTPASSATNTSTILSTSTSAPGQPTSTPFPGQPTSTLAPGQPSATATEPNGIPPTDEPTNPPPPTFMPTEAPPPDSDGDGLSDDEERRECKSNPNQQDTDDDGLNDFQECRVYGTDPNDRDTDNDRVSDGQEVNTYGTDPKNPNTDGDDCTDGFEIFSQRHYDPLDPKDCLIRDDD